MKDVSKLIANLSPEQRVELLQKLKSSKTQLVAEDVLVHDEASLLSDEPETAPKAGDNFFFSMERPGKLNSFSMVRKEILPPPPGHLQIRVKAASLNFRDVMIGMGMYSPAPGVPTVMGSDYAGVVSAVGEGMRDFKVGAEVFTLAAGSRVGEEGLDENSHFAAYLNVKPTQAALKPSNLSWEEAACIPTAFITSYYGLHYLARLKRGEKVLIHTASGGVGLSAIQVAKWLGAEIFVTAGTEAKREHLASIGLKKPIDSRGGNFAEEILERTGGEGVDVILNTLAGDAVEEGLRILKNFGRFLQMDKKEIAANRSLPLGHFKKGLSFSAIDLGLFYLFPEMTKQLMNEITQLFESGKFSPPIYTKFHVSELGQALTYLARSQHIGKVVLDYQL